MTTADITVLYGSSSPDESEKKAETKKNNRGVHKCFCVSLDEAREQNLSGWQRKNWGRI